jgi:radical SAM superfamily enzyme YgiQ (UPF0313 family)
VMNSTLLQKALSILYFGEGITLIESFINQNLLFEPNLGCAMIMGAAKQAEIPSKFIHSQINIIPYIFDHDLDIILDLLPNLDSEKYPKLVLDQSSKQKLIREENENLLNLFHYHQQPSSFFNYRQFNIYLNNFQFLHEAVETLIKEGYADQISFIEHFTKEILSSDPTLIGFSITTQLDPISRAIRKRIKALSDIPIVLGGSYTPFIPQNHYQDLLVNEAADFMVVGMGDLAFPRLYEAICDNRPPSNIPNIYFKTENALEGTPPEIIQDLDALPFPDFSQFSLDKYFAPERIIPIQSSRGCSWGHCSFCSHEEYSQGTYHTMSIPRVIDMLRHLQETYQTNYFSFHDAEIPPKRIAQISDAILADPQLSGKLMLKNYGRMEDGFLEPGFFEKARLAGFNSIYWGLESANQRVLNLIRKGIDIKSAHKILKSAHEAGVYNTLFIIFAFPGETKSERQDTIDFIKKNRDYIQNTLMGPFFLVSFSPIGNNPERWGVRILEDEQGWEMEDGSLSHKEAFKISDEYYRRHLLGEIGGKYTHVYGSYVNELPSRMLTFIFNSHGWLTPEELDIMVQEGQFGELTPIIPGTWQISESETIFKFYDFNKSYFLDSYFLIERPVTDLEKKIIELADSTRTINEIIKNLQENNENARTAEAARAFFKLVFEKQWGLAFRIPFQNR